jgi:hypothetical protein
MQKLERHIRDNIDCSSNTFTGIRGLFRAIPSPIINVIAESDLDRLERGEVIRNLDGATFVVIDAKTVANHLLLSLVPVPNTY